MSDRKSMNEIFNALEKAKAHFAGFDVRHISSGDLYEVTGAVWSTSDQCVHLTYKKYGRPGVVFSRDAAVFEGEKFERVSK